MELQLFRARKPSYDPYASDKDTSLLRYLRSLSPAAGGFDTPAKPSQMNSRGFSHGGPLSAIENTASPACIFSTILKLEEDVIVMDGIPAGGRMKSYAASDSGNLSAILSFANNLYKTEICRVWEETGICPYNSKCQFAHGKEELRPAAANKHPEFSYTIPDDSSCAMGKRSQARRSQQYESLSRRLPQPRPLSPSESEWSSIDEPSWSPPQAPPPSQRAATTTYNDWLPEDDGIHAIDQLNVADVIRNMETREHTAKFINDVLYDDSPARMQKRLPVFVQLKLHDE